MFKFLITVLALFSLVNAASPIVWQPPASFNKDIDGLGLPQLEGITNYIIYDPLPSSANVDEGGNGVYEGLNYGIFNHDAGIVLFHDKFIVYWNNHTNDENGPGQRVLAKVGTFGKNKETIDWGGNETLVELVPPPVAPRRRQVTHSPTVINENSGKGRMLLINGRIYSQGFVSARHGWTDSTAYDSIQSSPVPAEHWSDEKTSVFKYDVGWDIGPNFYQSLKICDDCILPAGDMFIYSPKLNTVQVTPGRFKTVASSTGPYLDSKDLSKASYMFRNDVTNGTPVSFLRIPLYAPGTDYIAADDLDGLSHKAEFQRPDGKWVVVRDNLLNRGIYYAAVKDAAGDYYPPAYPTNLYGNANMAAGELPDGTCWIIGNSISRREMFITVSSDGITFDKSWLLLFVSRVPVPGVGKSTSATGPQYFKTALVGDNLWVVYSIAKEQIGVTKIPISLLM